MLFSSILPVKKYYPVPTEPSSSHISDNAESFLPVFPDYHSLSAAYPGSWHDFHIFDHDKADCTENIENLPGTDIFCSPEKLSESEYHSL